MFLRVRDTAGVERFRPITTVYYRGAMGIIMVYDVTKERSFENIKTTWINLVRQHASTGVVKMLIGNMCDMEVWTPPP